MDSISSKTQTEQGYITNNGDDYADCPDQELEVEYLPIDYDEPMIDISIKTRDGKAHQGVYLTLKQTEHLYIHLKSLVKQGKLELKNNV